MSAIICLRPECQTTAGCQCSVDRWLAHDWHRVADARAAEISRLKAELDEAREIIQQQLGFPFGASERARTFLNRQIEEGEAR